MIIKIFIFLTIIIFLFSHTAFADTWFTKDKVSHFLVSFILGAAIHTSIDKNINCTEDESAALTFVSTVSIGVVKEFLDVQFNYKDLGADAAGAGLAASLKF